MKELSFAIIGIGFWARYQLAAWREVPGAKCVALYNRALAKAEALAREFGVPVVYDNAEELLQREKPDFLDIVTDLDTPSRFVQLAAAYQTPVICQKPMAPSIAEADVAIGAVAREIVPLMKAGALLRTLDPAAPIDDRLPRRDDIGCVIAHLCHSSVFEWEPTEQAFRDFYGGISAKQGIVVALMWGAESYYELGMEVSAAMYAPVSRVHRVTVEQMAMLEPALVETLAQTCMEVVKEGHDRVVAGVPEDAVRDFVLGHLRIQIAGLFGEVNGTCSDAAYKISKRAKPVLFKEAWQMIFELSDIREQVRDIRDK